MTDRESPGPAGPGQSMIGGLVLVVFAAIALYAMRDLDGGSLRAIGPGGLPRAVALLIALLGVVIAVIGWRRADATRMEAVTPRPVIVILVAIFVFAATIRPWDFGAFSTPGLGLVGAGPLTVLVAGFAERERNWRDLAILACALTAFCMILFGDLLALPIPVMPIALLEVLPGWPQRTVLRLLAAGLAGLALAFYLAPRRRGGVA